MNDYFNESGGHNNHQINGVLVGLVIDNHDPKGLGRVKIKLPGSSDDEIGHWARVSSLMAGKQRGAFFLPEPEDEVLVAFEAGDISRPYILGALWNGMDEPPEKNNDGKNNIRMIRSRSGHIVRLDDTENAEKIEIIDKTGKNLITFDSKENTITVQADKDIAMKAPQGKFSIEAKNIEIKSTADSKMESGAKMDIKASSTMNIKGATVNIN